MWQDGYKYSIKTQQVGQVVVHAIILSQGGRRRTISEFQGSQGYIIRTCLVKKKKKKKKKKSKTTKEQIEPIA
jgi:hypothetical protein